MTSRIKTARRALGDDGESQRYIRTVRGRGYQFVGMIDTDTEPPEAPPEPELAAPRQHIAFCRAADGGRGTAACQGGQLDDPSRLRHRKPGVEALGA